MSLHSLLRSWGNHRRRASRLQRQGADGGASSSATVSMLYVSELTRFRCQRAAPRFPPIKEPEREKALTPSPRPGQNQSLRCCRTPQTRHSLVAEIRMTFPLHATQATVGDSIPATGSFALSPYLPFEPRPSQPLRRKHWLFVAVLYPLGHPQRLGRPHRDSCNASVYAAVFEPLREFIAHELADEILGIV
jgi:hypothetical protein